MQNITLESFFQDRMEENKELFTEEEMEQICTHKRCAHKVYMLGLMDSRECYKNDEILDWQIGKNGVRYFLVMPI